MWRLNWMTEFGHPGLSTFSTKSIFEQNVLIHCIVHSLSSSQKIWYPLSPIKFLWIDTWNRNQSDYFYIYLPGKRWFQLNFEYFLLFLQWKMKHFWVAISTLFFICSFDPVYFISPCWLHSVRFSLNGHFDWHTLSCNKTHLSNSRRKYELLPPKTININKQQEVDGQRQWTIEHTAINKSQNWKENTQAGENFTWLASGKKGMSNLQ